MEKNLESVIEKKPRGKSLINAGAANLEISAIIAYSLQKNPWP